MQDSDRIQCRREHLFVADAGVRSDALHADLLRLGSLYCLRQSLFCIKLRSVDRSVRTWMEHTCSDGATGVARAN